MIMEKKQGFLMNVLPWLLIILGFLTLDMFQGYVSLACMVIGIVMLIERVCPEKCEDGYKKNNTVVK